MIQGVDLSINITKPPFVSQHEVASPQFTGADETCDISNISRLPERMDWI